MIAYADNRPTKVYRHGEIVIYIDGHAVTEATALHVRDAIVAVPPFHCPPWKPFEDELRDLRTKAERRRDELRAWTRHALLIRSLAARVKRFRDPSQWEGGFRVRGRACGSSWRTTLR